MSGELTTQSPAWLDELIEATLAFATAVCGLPPMRLVPGAPWLVFDERPPMPTYRTEPIEGAELGGQPRNPEADVIDEIDRLVDWQLEEGKR